VQILVHCDDQICCSEELIRRVEGVLAGTLERFEGRVCRIEARLRDLSGEAVGHRHNGCNLEARIAGGGCVPASHEAATLAEAIHEAADKLKRMVARELQLLDGALPSSEVSPRPGRS